MSVTKPTVLFHVLETNSAQNAKHFVAEYLQRQYQNQIKTLLLTETKDEALEWDQFLWSYQKESFLPHLLFDKQHILTEVIQIAHDTSFFYPFPHLINVTDCVPIYTEHFNVIHEVVYHDARIQEVNRAKYRRYQHLKYKIDTLKIATQTQSKSETL